MTDRTQPRHIHFVQSLEPLQGGGLGAAALQLHASMRAANLDSRLITTRAASFTDQWPDVSQFRRLGPTKAFFAPRLASFAEAEILDGESTVIHGHGFYVYPNFVFGRLARRRNAPLVYHPHGMFEPWILERSRKKKHVAHWLFEDANFRQARLWRALTVTEADQIRAVVGSNVSIIVAPNGVELRPFDAVNARSAKARRRALFLGRLHPKKGLDLLIRAWTTADKNGEDWELVIAGPDEAGFGARVKQWVSDAGPSCHITLPGTVTGENKLELLASADLFLLPSYSEGLPMAVLEAMASRIPVLITPGCNLPEVAEVGAGWICDANVDSVRGALTVAIQASDQERSHRGTAGRTLVEKRFSWPKICADLNGACAALLEQTGLGG